MSTFITPETPQSGTAPKGGAWCVTVRAIDELGNLVTTVTPTVVVTRPDGSTVTPAPALDADQHWTTIYTLDASGRYLMHVSTPEDALDFAVYAYAPGTVPTLNEVVDYLGGRNVAGVDGAYRAELGAQRDKCGERAEYPDQLREALYRRVSRNLAMRQLPLAMSGGDAEAGPALIPGNDPEVRRLEAPWRRLVVG